MSDKLPMDSSGFLVLADFIPQIVQEIRYYSTFNFVGDRIDGYEEPCALLTMEAARALKAVSNEMIVKGYRLKIFDAYRPVCAVNQFKLWAIEDLDVRMKEYFYPEIEKQDLFKLGYIAARSSHSRGSTVDLTLLDMKSGREVDMGSPFDRFGAISHPDYLTNSMKTECCCRLPWFVTDFQLLIVNGGILLLRMSLILILILNFLYRQPS